MKEKKRPKCFDCGIRVDGKNQLMEREECKHKEEHRFCMSCVKKWAKIKEDRFVETNALEGKSEEDLMNACPICQEEIELKAIEMELS